jgi:hypothetical protein
VTPNIELTLIVFAVLWLCCGASEIFLALRLTFGREVYVESGRVLTTLAFIITGPIGLGMVLVMRQIDKTL